MRLRIEAQIAGGVAMLMLSRPGAYTTLDEKRKPGSWFLSARDDG